MYSTKKPISVSSSDNNNNNHSETTDSLYPFCNNCGRIGHQFHQCKMPITSIGIVAFRFHPEKKRIEYLLIRRKDTLGYIDFLRGKFPLNQKEYILNMMKQMTVEEKNKLRHKYEMKIQPPPGFNTKTYVNSNGYDILSLLTESDKKDRWAEPEWGFPKGRRNNQENDYDCALREFTEETGYDSSKLKNIRNVIPFEEIFTGSNYKSYRHKYYLMYMDYTDSIESNAHFQKSEVSSMDWKPIEECLSCIRYYNYEKKRMIYNINQCLLNTYLVPGICISGSSSEKESLF